MLSRDRALSDLSLLIVLEVSETRNDYFSVLIWVWEFSIVFVNIVIKLGYHCLINRIILWCLLEVFFISYNRFVSYIFVQISVSELLGPDLHVARKKVYGRIVRLTDI